MKKTSPEGQQLPVSHQFLDHPKTDDILGFTFLLKFFLFIEHKWMKIQDKTLVLNGRQFEFTADNCL